jgi:hypothetical protein
LPRSAIFRFEIEPSQTQGCEPVIVNPNGNLTINYLDTCEAPLSPMHLAFSAGLCMLFCGNEGLDGERKAMRHAMIVENLQQLYTDIFNDWIVENEQVAEELRWRATAIDRYLKLRLRGSQLNFIDAFAAFRDWELQHPDEASNFMQELSEEAVAEFAKNPSTANFPEHATEMRAAANFLVANYGRQKIITMPRSVPKIAIFEEAARTLEFREGSA